MNPEISVYRFSPILWEALSPDRYALALDERLPVGVAVPVSDLPWETPPGSPTLLVPVVRSLIKALDLSGETPPYPTATRLIRLRRDVVRGTEVWIREE